MASYKRPGAVSPEVPMDYTDGEAPEPRLGATDLVPVVEDLQIGGYLASKV